jgi:hypothetical protein
MSPFQIQQAIRTKLGAKYPFDDVHIEYHFHGAMLSTALHIWIFFGAGSDRCAVNTFMRLMTDVVTKREVDVLITVLDKELFRHLDPIQTPADHV